MKKKELRIEDLLSRIDIQGQLRQLESEDREMVESALHSLASIARLSQRRDCLIAIAGYYALHVRSLDEIEMFIRATRVADSLEIAQLVVRDLVRIPEASRRRLLMNDLLRMIESLIHRSSPEQAEPLLQWIESGAWGDKQKLKFRALIRSRQIE
jgi:hypothetical protein